VLQHELRIVAERFGRLLIFPAARGVCSPGFVPRNAVVSDLLMSGCRPRRDLVRWHLCRAAVQLVRQVGAGRPRPTLLIREIRDGWWIARREARKAALLEDYVAEHRLGGALFYDYWFEDSLMALALLRQRGAIHSLVCRAHNFDLYDDRWPSGRVPFREFKMRQLDRVYAISADAAAYLRARVPFGLHAKISVSRLGVPAPRKVMEARPNPPYRIVSVSHLGPLKRVHEIPAVLRQVPLPLEWVHFGSGPMLDETAKRSASLPANISWSLRGLVTNNEILNYYQTHRVDLLVSLSASEGIPVSMMEATSHGIPVLATDVGAVRELVTARTGRLLPPDSEPACIAGELVSMLRGYPFDRRAVHSFSRERYSAETNFSEFADRLAEDRGGPPGA
jgi:glycosyltransferase involved in cell wall biosynthesis